LIWPPSSGGGVGVGLCAVTETVRKIVAIIARKPVYRKKLFIRTGLDVVQWMQAI
jgi:hypothetical protein